MNEEEHLVKVEEMKGEYTVQAIPTFQLFAEDNIKENIHLIFSLLGNFVLSRGGEKVLH